MDLTTATPVEFDTALAALYTKRYGFQDVAEREWGYVRNYVGILLGVRFRDADTKQVRDFLAEYSEISESEELQAEAYPNYYERQHAANAWKRYLLALDAEAQADDVWHEIAEYDEVYRARGSWTRAYLVDNSNGHVHSSMNCSSCYPTTRYHWLIEMADHTEAEIVEKAGERACTVCYPSAPVEHLARPTQFFTPDEQAKQAARAEREAKRAEKEAAQIVVTGLTGWTNGSGGTHTYKTTRAATNAIAGWLGDIETWHGNHPSVGEWRSNVERVRQALADKGVDYDYDKALAAARKKARR